MAGGSLIGTPAYMAPEQLAGDEVDHRADIFAVGLVMYELLSGRRAFLGATTAEILQSVMRAEPVPLNTLVPHIDPDLVQCVNRALAKRPDDRYQGLQELRNDIGRVRRRSEYESGSFDATIVVQLPPQTRAVPPAGPSTAPGRTGTEADARPSHDEEAEALRHFASGAGRVTRPVVVPANVDETIYAGVTPVIPITPPAPPPAPDRLIDAEAPTMVVPIYSPGATAVPPLLVPVAPHDPMPPPPPLAPARRSVVPALIVLAIVVVMLVVVTIGALWWLKSVVADRLALVTSTETVVDTPVARADSLPDAVEPVPPTVLDPAAVSEPATLAAPARVPEPAAQTPPAPRPDLVRRPSAPPASQQALARPVSVPSAVVPPAVPSPPAPAATTTPDVAVNREIPAPASIPAPVPVPRDEGLVLVRAYVAARNTAHAAGIRRVWPTVSDNALRRMTGEFSAPLTLTDCDVDALGASRMRATCRFTQPGSTASGGTALSVRRQLVFDIERQGRGWVIADVEG
jgi:serine/threonine-protein kinase